MEVEAEQMEITIGGPMASKVVDSCVDTDNRRYYKLEWDPSWESEEDVVMKYQTLVESYWREEERKSQMQANAMVDVVLNKAVNDRNNMEVTVENLIAVSSPEHRLDEQAPIKDCPPPLLPQDRDGVIHQYQCDECPRSYTTERKLKDHKRKLHVNRGSYKCSFCPKVFSSKRGAQEHINRHTGMGPNMCPGCNKRYITVNDLEHHKKSCNGLISKEHQCEVCRKGFATKAHLSFHMKIHVPNEQKPFGCKYCPRRFAYNHDCVHHMRLHLGEKPFQCKECDQAFHRKSYLTEHMFVHTGVSRYKCNDCGVYVKTQQMLKTHVKNAHILMKLPSAMENNENSEEKPNEHKNRKDKKNDKRKNKRYKCNECKKDFRFMKELHFHQALNHKEKLKDNSLKVQFEDFEPTMVYKCKKCEKTFPHPSSLRKHSETHKLLELPTQQQQQQQQQCDHSDQSTLLNSVQIIHPDHLKQDQNIQPEQNLKSEQLISPVLQLKTDHHLEPEHHQQTGRSAQQAEPFDGSVEGKQQVEDHISIILEQSGAFTTDTNLNQAIPVAEVLTDNLIQVKVAGGETAHILLPTSFTCGLCHSIFLTEVELTQHIYSVHEPVSDEQHKVEEKVIQDETLNFAETLATPKDNTGMTP